MNEEDHIGASSAETRRAGRDPVHKARLALECFIMACERHDLNKMQTISKLRHLASLNDADIQVAMDILFPLDSSVKPDRPAILKAGRIIAKRVAPTNKKKFTGIDLIGFATGFSNAVFDLRESKGRRFLNLDR